MSFYLDIKGRHLDTAKLFAYRALSWSLLSMRPHIVIPLPGIRELAILLTLSESLAEGAFKLLTIGSMRKNFTTELSWHLEILK